MRYQHPTPICVLQLCLGAEFRRLFTVCQVQVRSLLWLADAAYVVTACETGMICVWDVNMGALVSWWMSTGDVPLRSRYTGDLLSWSRRFKMMLPPCGNQLVVFLPGSAQALDVSRWAGGEMQVEAVWGSVYQEGGVQNWAGKSVLLE